MCLARLLKLTRDFTSHHTVVAPNCIIIILRSLSVLVRTNGRKKNSGLVSLGSFVNGPILAAISRQQIFSRCYMYDLSILTMSVIGFPLLAELSKQKRRLLDSN